MWVGVVQLLTVEIGWPLAFCELSLERVPSHLIVQTAHGKLIGSQESHCGMWHPVSVQ